MARPLRLEDTGLVHHVMARGNNRMRIFVDDVDYARLVGLFRQLAERFQADTWTFCGMPNHYHLVLRTRAPRLSDAIHYVNGTYAQWWNKRHGRRGHVFEGRFKSQCVETGTYLLRLCRYVLHNPVRAGLCQVPSEWKWSNYAALHANTPARGIDKTGLFAALDPDDARVGRERLLSYVGAESDDEMQALVRGNQRVIGTRQFASQFTSRALVASREVPAAERRIGTPSLPELIANTLAAGDGLGAAVMAARDLGHPVTDIARCVGLSWRTTERLLRAQVRAGATSIDETTPARVQ